VLFIKPQLTSRRTAELAANSPRFRRKSSTFVDAIHDLPEKVEMAPAQLYSTESGRLFHSGKIAIATVGLPARGKTFVSQMPAVIDFETDSSRNAVTCLLLLHDICAGKTLPLPLKAICVEEP
jgi:hypothetical protein